MGNRVVILITVLTCAVCGVWCVGGIGFILYYESLFFFIKQGYRNGEKAKFKKNKYNFHLINKSDLLFHVVTNEIMEKLINKCVCLFARTSSIIIF